MHDIEKFVSFLGLLGIPSIFTILMWCLRSCLNFKKQLNILMKSQQAQMRTKLLELHHRYVAQGYIDDDDLEDWENQYQSYHTLGQNGVLDTRREELLQLPNIPPTTI